MRKRVLAWAISFVFLALPAYGADKAATADVTKSLKQTASKVKNLLVKEKVHNAFDSFRRLQKYGATWQPALIAPNDLVNKLDDEGLRLYAGVKTFDAVYATTFMQRKAASDSAQTIQAIQDKLNVRAYADLSGDFFATLKKALAKPESVNVQQLLDRLAADYVKDIPAMMSTPESADFLIDGLYGFTIQTQYVESWFHKNDVENKFDKGAHLQPDRGEWLGIMLKLYKAFDRMDEKIRVSGETTEKVAVLERLIAAHKAEKKAGDPATDAAYRETDRQIEAIRTAILTPTTKQK